MSRDVPGMARTAALLSAVEKNLDLQTKTPVDASAWFLGPRAENAKALLEFIGMAAEGQIATRRQYMPDDPAIFDESTEEHEKAIGKIRHALDELLTQLRGSIPLASYRNQSHMYWDLTLPGTAGYFAAMLYNQNNVAAEASPVTTLLEIQVGRDLCDMLGFARSPGEGEDAIEPWGHITCDGSIANGESMWAARNLKFLPVALAAAIEAVPELEAAKDFQVDICEGGRSRLIDLTSWQLLNLPIDEVIGLVFNIAKRCKIEQAIIRDAVDKYSVQNIGLIEFRRRYLESDAEATPLVLAPGSAHYSWPKTAALIGLGSETVKSIAVDLDARMSVDALRDELSLCLKAQRPVMQVVAVMGSTAEGAVDPLADIIRLREEFQQQGLNFVIHVDGAWGGYFRSILRQLVGSDPAEVIDKFPLLHMNPYFKKHFTQIANVDSVTLDPHKSGFIPYPAGSLCYRNGDMRYLIAYSSPVVSHGGTHIDVGTYGIEGSKPGAAAASVYLSHKVIPLNMSGYGRLLGRCLFNSKRFYAALMAMDLPDSEGRESRFTITALQRLPAEKEEAGDEDVMKQKQYLKEHIVPYPTSVLIKKVFGLGQSQQSDDQKEALEFFQSIGSDLSIISYAFNFKTDQGLNSDPELMNRLNDKIFEALSLQASETRKIPSVEMFVTASEFDPRAHGQKLVESFARRAGVKRLADQPIKFLISTTQNPWLSTTSKDFNMIDTLIEVLTRTVNKAIDELIDEQQAANCEESHP